MKKIFAILWYGTYAIATVKMQIEGPVSLM